MYEEEEETNFPVDVESKFVNFLQKAILYSIKFLALLMTLVVIWSVIDLAINVFHKAIEPPFLLVTADELLKTFGAFLMVLIAVEIFINIILYFKKNVSHLRLVIATALMAIARKVIILDYEKAHFLQLVGIGVIIAALALAYFIIKPNFSKKKSLKEG